MTAARRKRLETDGWKFGNAADFLKLTPEERALVDLRLALANKLKEQRRTSHLTQITLAKLLGSSQSRVAKIESGDKTVSMDLLFKAVFATGASINEVGRWMSHINHKKVRRAVAH